MEKKEKLLSWEQAKRLLKLGKKVTRQKWKDKNVFLFMGRPVFGVRIGKAKSMPWIFIKDSRNLVSPYEWTLRRTNARDYILLEDDKSEPSYPKIVLTMEAETVGYIETGVNTDLEKLKEKNKESADIMLSEEIRMCEDFLNAANEAFERSK
ncbi:DUF2829 domain-containing protein [Fusobacterium ulcerans]|uniref:Thoeris anti-defense Tad2 family protein n=1 Tax=Fusobacterium ulcerans TaxID=861 RepID=UPI000E5470D0|nr:DUF2829 domain-containing protein [Fusobacterium ulcerans]RGY64514.1 DUF2829 domain-containing protein [Fusobacterium ulcerans]